MIFDNGWIDVNEADELPPNGRLCQVLVQVADGSFHAAACRLTENGWGYFGNCQDRKVIAHQPLTEVPTPTKPTLAVRLAAQTAQGMTTGMALEIIKFIDSERAKDALAIQRLEVKT